MCNYPFGYCEETGICNCSWSKDRSWSVDHSRWWSSGPFCECGVSVSSYDEETKECLCDWSSGWVKKLGTSNKLSQCKCDNATRGLVLSASNNSDCVCKFTKGISVANRVAKRCVCDIENGWINVKNGEVGECECDESKGLSNKLTECVCDEENGLESVSTISIFRETGERVFCSCAHGSYIGGKCECNVGYKSKSKWECVRDAKDYGPPEGYKKVEHILLIVFASLVLVCVCMFALACAGMVIALCTISICKCGRGRRKIAPYTVLTEKEPDVKIKNNITSQRKKEEEANVSE